MRLKKKKEKQATVSLSIPGCYIPGGQTAVCRKGDRSAWRSAEKQAVEVPCSPSPACPPFSSLFPFIQPLMLRFSSFLLARLSFSFPSALPRPAPRFDAPLPPVPCLRSFMSFWPRSRFPNWLSGSLIILRHPCCRLLYRSACRRPNPLISKHPSSAHTASQQPAAFTVFSSTVHTDGPPLLPAGERSTE